MHHKLLILLPALNSSRSYYYMHRASRTRSYSFKQMLLHGSDMLLQPVFCLQITLLHFAGSTSKNLLYMHPNPSPTRSSSDQDPACTCFCFCPNPTNTSVFSHEDPAFTRHCFDLNPTPTSLCFHLYSKSSCSCPLTGGFCLDSKSYGGLQYKLLLQHC